MDHPPAIDLTRDEWELVEEHAAEANLTLHEYVRRRLTSRRVESDVLELTAGDEEAPRRFLRISARHSVQEPCNRDIIVMLCEPGEHGEELVVASDMHSDITEALSVIMSHVSRKREIAGRADDAAAPATLAKGDDEVVEKQVER